MQPKLIITEQGGQPFNTTIRKTLEAFTAQWFNKNVPIQIINRTQEFYHLRLLEALHTAGQLISNVNHWHEGGLTGEQDNEALIFIVDAGPGPSGFARLVIPIQVEDGKAYYVGGDLQTVTA